MFTLKLIKNTPERAAKYYTQNFSREDYYIKGDEPPGIWSKSCEQLGLTGIVNKEDMLSVMKGNHPISGESLVSKSDDGSKRLGYDCSFSAPKEFSLLWARSKLCDQQMYEKLNQVHEDAINNVINNFILKNLNNNLTRRVYYDDLGRKRNRYEPVKNLFFSTFKHRCSRDMDPHLHTHVFFYNLAERKIFKSKSERFGSINFGDVFKNMSTIGAIYRAELGKLLVERTGISIRNNGHSFAIDGIKTSLVDHFSKRRNHIRFEAIKRGIDLSDRVKNSQLGENTRSRKRLVHDDLLFKFWNDEMKKKGFSERDFRTIANGGMTITSASIESKYEEFFQNSLKKMLKKDSTFSRFTAEFELSKQCQATFGLSDFIKIKDLFWNDDRIISVGNDNRGNERFTDLSVLSEEFNILFRAKKIHDNDNQKSFFGNLKTKLKDSVIEFLMKASQIGYKISDRKFKNISSELISSPELYDIIESECIKNLVESNKEKIEVFRCVHDLNFVEKKLNSRQTATIISIINKMKDLYWSSVNRTFPIKNNYTAVYLNMLS